MTRRAPIPVERLPLRFEADDRLILLRPFLHGGASRARSVLDRVSHLDDAAVESLLEGVRADFAHRHPFDLDTALEHHGRQAMQKLDAPPALSPSRHRLVGSYFTMEYTIASAALFNPSIVAHPDQQGAPPGGLRFIMSFRATGEGHLSSVIFRTGTIHADGRVEIGGAPRGLRSLDVVPGSEAGESYDLLAPPGIDLDQGVLFPQTANESRGLEDLRLVRFEDGPSPIYYGTYTAYDGRQITPKIIETVDFRRFHVRAITGDCGRDKGMALFPRRVGGRYLMCSRIDGENLYLMESDRVDHWDAARPLYTPTLPWEFMQIGNCGSPLETPAGWLLLTHGVGPMRTYSIGALLLDREDPHRVIGQLEEPLLFPVGEEREGYVPNVVYTCGALLHGDRLYMPYAMSDSASSLAVVGLDPLLERLTGR